jgi:hypothetical protein
MSKSLDELDSVKVELDALRAENARLREALHEIAANAAVPGFEPEQRHAIWRMARAASGPYGQKERRAKALSELAEIDADLLDIEPEVKPAWPPAGCIRIDSCERHGQCMYLGCVNQGKKAAQEVKP